MAFSRKCHLTKDKEASTKLKAEGPGMRFPTHRICYRGGQITIGLKEGQCNAVAESWREY